MLPLITGTSSISDILGKKKPPKLTFGLKKKNTKLQSTFNISFLNTTVSMLDHNGKEPTEIQLFVLVLLEIVTLMISMISLTTQLKLKKPEKSQELEKTHKSKLKSQIIKLVM